MDRFKKIEDGIYEDTKTGLQWSDTIGNMTWQEAVEACENLDLCGNTEWRLPTIQEFLEIVDYNLSCPATELPCTKPSRYWSMTNYADNIRCSWCVDFYYGDIIGNGIKSYCYFIRAVRENQKK